MVKFTKIGNRYYKQEGSLIIKATYDENEDTFMECGRYKISEFNNLTDENLDENTRIKKQEIKEKWKL